MNKIHGKINSMAKNADLTILCLLPLLFPMIEMLTFWAQLFVVKIFNYFNGSIRLKIKVLLITDFMISLTTSKHEHVQQIIFHLPQ